jgi:diaminopimelate epimerase
MIGGGREVAVVKMHGSENVFALIDERPPRFEGYAEIARTICAKDGPIGGADGILAVLTAPGFAAEMRIFNADGSEAEMCGNGVRCVARYLVDRGATDRFTISTLAGPIGVNVVKRKPAFEVCVDIGLVTFPNGLREERLSVPDLPRTYYNVAVGNPHAVFFVDDVEAIDLEALGAELPSTNVHVVRVIDDRTLHVRHFERGVGATRACGTGAVACAAVATVVRGVRAPVTVEVPGGHLTVDWHPGETARLTGPAERVFERTLSL